jgi:hypothetical protein
MGCVIVHDEMSVQTVWNSGFDLIENAGIGAGYPDFPRAGRSILRLEAAGIDPASSDSTPSLTTSTSISPTRSASVEPRPTGV